MSPNTLAARLPRLLVFDAIEARDGFVTARELAQALGIADVEMVARWLAGRAKAKRFGRVGRGRYVRIATACRPTGIVAESKREYHREYMRQKRRNRRAAGVCVICTEPTTHYRCAGCREDEKGVAA